MRVAVLLLLLGGCEYFKISAEGDTAESEEWTDEDTQGDDSGGSGDSDSDDSGGDSGGDSGVDDTFCDESFSTDAPGGPECVTSVLSCGDTVDATTEGGGEAMDAENWEGWYCSINLDRHPYDGPERVFQVLVPERTFATFSLETPCVDHDVFAFYWQDTDTCPGADQSLVECEAGDDEDDDDAATVWADDSNEGGSWYLVAVDAKDGETGNFRLSVTCEE